MKKVEVVCNILKKASFHQINGEKTVPLFEQIEEKMNNNERLVFLLPAFPAKSPSPEKTSGNLPDLGEVLALKRLHEICQDIDAIYAPGAQIIICSDGRVFADIVNVSDEQINQYQDGIQKIIDEFSLSSLLLFSLDDVYLNKENDELRNLLLNSFARNIEEIRESILNQDDFKKLFNGLHRFLLEDELVLANGLSKNKVAKTTKLKTYELMRRSEAWSLFLEHHFPNYLRLSIHPYEVEHSKFGVQLVSGSTKWATPWHNVTVKIKNTFQLMHMSEAKKLNASLRKLEDRYVYFEVASI